MKLKRKKCKVCQKRFQPKNSLQQVCSYRCAIKLMKLKKQKKHERLKKTQEPDRLRREADKLYQEVYKKKYPKSIISGEPTQVIHHFIYKSHSNNLRYDEDNAIPLTNKEHYEIHNGTSASEYQLIIISKMGNTWSRRIRNKSKEIVKLTISYLKETIEELKKTLLKM